jgi:hypothetical protein
MISGTVCDQNPIFWVLKQTVALFCSIVFLLFKECANYGIFMLCVMTMVTTIVVGADLGTRTTLSLPWLFCVVDDDNGHDHVMPQTMHCVIFSIMSFRLLVLAIPPRNGNV